MRKHILPFAAIALLVAACGDTKLLASRTMPDETRVIDGPTLALPPDFNLRPPTEADDYEAVLRAQKTAEAKALLGGSASATTVSGPVPAEDAWLTERAGAADEDIRATLEAEAAQNALEQEDKTLWDKMMDKVNN